MSLRLTSMLYVPGIDEHKMAKIDTFSPNGFIIDLEDAVAISAKTQAREIVRSFLTSYKGDQQLWVRVNGFDTGLLFEDIEAVVTSKLVGIVVPKVESAQNIKVVDWLLGEFEGKQGLPKNSIHIMPIIETAIGSARLEEIARASTRNICLAFGAGDYSLDLGIEWPPPDGILNPLVLNAKIRLAEISRVCGLQAPHDGAFPNFRDDEALAIEARYAYSLGFGGKHAVHPNQVEVINKSFAPSEKQILWARRVLEAFAESEARGIAAIELDGRFIDYPVVYRARQVVAAGEQFAAGSAR